MSLMVKMYHKSCNIQLNSTNDSSPCLPTVFTFGSVTITFNSTNVQDIDDWYPLKICSQRKYNKNNYMFDSLGNMILLNLRINDYHISEDTNYPLIHGGRDISCTNCSFINITCTVDTPLLYFEDAEITVAQSIFTNISSIADIFYGHLYGINLEQTSFINIFNTPSIIHPLMNSLGFFAVGNTIIINECYFQNIFVSNAMFFDGSEGDFVNISNTNINISTGSIYYSDHQNSKSIFITNSSIHATEINYDRIQDVATFTSLNIVYQYDAVVNCQFHDSIWNSVITTEEDYDYYICKNPIQFIESFGQVFKYETFLSINFCDHCLFVYRLS